MARTIERAEPRNPRRFSGKPIAIGLAVVLVVGTAVTTYFSWQGEVARQQARDAIEAADRAEAPP